ncbi:FAD-binding oxidoreductase [Streptomyces sp. NBC_00287]|uniref:FAD-binding oxidoreductase n=1 Tax=Streptomyces sp. NBC_00287 TaxID=2975702 RepID=UPI002E2A9E89|nr:FAD-binding oxidoreductase [Streptomyces sp. NBC_00287]
MSPISTPPVHDDFPAAFRGAVLRPGDDGFDQARVICNGRAGDTVPALIAQCVDEDDVATALRYASARDLPVAVRGGGHGSDGHAMPGGAFVLDLSGMRGITVDPDTRTVRAQAGVLLGELDAATQEHGLVVPSGTVTSTGVAGLTLGGGIGHLHRRFGATVDNLIACEMVTVDGRKVRADETENPDLFWALRGGGGNFGVVTAFEFRAHPLGPDVCSGMIVFPGEEATSVLNQVSGYMAGAPRELGLATSLTIAPPLPDLPHEVHGRLILILLPVHTGDAEEAEKTIADLAALGTPLLNTVRRATWLETNSQLDALFPYGLRAGARGGYLASLTEETVTALIERASASPKLPGTATVCNVWAFGGAFSEDVDEDATAFSRAGASWLWEAGCQWAEPEHDARMDAWADATLAAMRPHTLPNSYINLTEDQGEEWRRGVYGSEAKYRRLTEIKAAWDPKNLLRHNKNITPTTNR